MKGKVHNPKKDQDPGKAGYAESDEDEESGVDTGEGTPKGEGTAKACKKSVSPADEGEVEASDLEKSISKLEEFAKSEDPVSRKDALLEKAKAGTLEGAERDELFKALGGEVEQPVADEPVAEDLVKGFQENEGLQKAIDVSDYLTEQHTELCKSLETVGEIIEKSDLRAHEFNLVLAKAVADTGNLVKGIADKLDVIGAQPARAPKSAGVAGQPMEKSFAGHAPSGDRLSREQVLNGLDVLMEKSMQNGMDGMTQDGEDILKSVSKYEQTHQITESMLARVNEVIRERAH
jgi:hypothetical protein